MEGDSSISLELLIIFVLIIANGLFAMTEIAIVSSRKARLAKRAAEGSAGAKTALDLANDPTQLLSTIQVGISAIGVATGAYGGATIAAKLQVYFARLPMLGAYAETVSLVVVITVLTYLSLIIGELVPKKMALNNPEPIAISVAVPMRIFAKVFSPLVKLLSLSTEFVLKLIGAKEPDDSGVSEEEIKIMIAEGTAIGTFEETERDIVDRVFRLGDLRVSSLMTPRTQIDWIDLEESDEINWSVISESNHSKLPVGNGSLDDILGVVYVRSLLSNKCGSPLPIKENIKDPLFVPSSLRAFKLLERFQRTGTHIAFIMDEFGGMAGLVTLHDILEQLVGELPEEADETPSILKRDDSSWLIDGLLPIEEFRELFALGELPGEESSHYKTIGGFITSYLGSMPKTGETFEWEGLKFEIVDMDRMRIDKVMVTKLNTTED